MSTETSATTVALPDGAAGATAPAPPPPPSPPPRRGPRLWAILAVLGAACAAFVAGAYFGPGLRQRAAAPGRSIAPAGHDHGRPGDGAADGRAAEAEGAPGEGRSYYTCGMHPWVIVASPGVCPICHMDLVPLDPAKFTGQIAIDPVITQSIGVRVEPVVTGPLERTIRTVGTVEYNEPAVRDVNIKIAGWIERLHVDSLGAPVQRGDPLFELYSPELYAAQEEYLVALRRQRQSGGAAAGWGGPGDLLEAARTRLRYLDVSDEQIAALERAGVASKTMTITSPHTGVVIEKHANEGMRVDPGMLVYRIADLSTVWVLVSLYEYQMPYVRQGQRAVMTLPYIPGQRFEGRVVYVYPYLDPRTRQGTVRLEFANPDGLLKPGMYANVELTSTLAEERTLAPRSAIIDTGTRRVAFVSLGDGRFEPRQVQVGAEDGRGWVEIRDGLEPGELVVASGQFLLDSEARMREGLAKMMRGELAVEPRPAAAGAGEAPTVAMPPAASAALSDVLRAAFAIGDRLASDTTEGIGGPAREAAAAVDRLLATPVPDQPHLWHEHDETATIRGKAIELADEADLARARLLYADFSVALINLVRSVGVPASFESEVHRLRCPMYLEDQGGGVWLQPAGPARNPYYGSVMLGCFDERVAMPVAGDGADAGAGSYDDQPDRGEQP